MAYYIPPSAYEYVIIGMSVLARERHTRGQHVRVSVQRGCGDQGLRRQSLCAEWGRR